MAREVGNDFKFSYPHKLDSPNSPKDLIISFQSAGTSHRFEFFESGYKR